MKALLKFGLVYSCLSLALFVLGAWFWPESYSDERFLIVYLYILNIAAETTLLPFMFPVVELLRINARWVSVLLYFLLTLAISNIIPLLLIHGSLTLFYIDDLANSYPEERLRGILGLVNPLLTFGITYWIFRRSAIWRYSR